MPIRRRTRTRIKKIRLSAPGKLKPFAKGVIAHLEHGWIPVHPTLLNGIKLNIANGHYQDHPSALIADVQKDPGLFFTITKRLRPFSSIEQPGFEPILLLTELGQRELEEVFLFKPGSSSIHRFGEASPSQLLMWRICLTSSKAAFHMAEALGLSSAVAYTGTLFRQISLYLLCWNYSKLFAQALARHRNAGVDFTQELITYFQIAPSQIAVRFARQYELNREVKQALIVRKESLNESEHVGQHPLRMNEVCQTAELFARAQCYSSFPDAEGAWEQKHEAISSQFPDGFFERLRAEIALYEDFVPEATDFGDLTISEGDESGTSKHQNFIPKSNPHLARCPEHVQRAFIEVHRELERSETALYAIKTLLEKGIPETGISRGCLFIDTGGKLRPALRFGEVALPEYRKLMNNNRMGIFETIAQKGPFIREVHGVTGDPVIQVRGGLNDTELNGVLYLEFDKKTGDPEADPKLSFRIIRSSIAECIKHLDEDDLWRISFY